MLDYRSDSLDGHGPYDVIIDTGGNRGIGELRKLLGPEGRLIIVGGEGGDRLTGGVHRQVRAMLLSLTTEQKLGTFIASEDGGSVVELGKLITAGQLEPAVDRSFPLELAGEAIAHLLDGKARGKIVISIA